MALVFFGFFGFLWHWFWPEFEIGNWFFLVFLAFFGFFLAFFGFFGIGLDQHSKLETGFLGSVGFFGFFFGFFFWDFLVSLVFKFRVRMSSQKIPKKNQKKTKKKPKKNQKNPKKTKKNQSLHQNW